MWDPQVNHHRILPPIFYRYSKIVFLTYDLTSEKSFDALEYLVREIRTKVPDNALLYLIGNKLDLE